MYDLGSYEVLCSTLCDSICNSDEEINYEKLQVVTSLINTARCDVDLHIII